MRSVRLICLAGLPLAVLILTLLVGSEELYAGGGTPLRGPEDRIWLFNFAPDATRDVEGFTKVSARTVYDKKRGYGWVDLKGDLKTGNWGDASLPWEGCENLNVVCRPGPDDVGRTYATGSATFALDLPKGKYEVWVLTGDWGLAEQIPHEPYSIKVEKSGTGKIAVKTSDFYRAYETALADDTIGDWEAYLRYVKPRFAWKKIETRVSDGQLSVQVQCRERSRQALKYMGSYEPGDIRMGPQPRFTGALNAMMITPETPHKVFGINRTEMIEAARRDNFRRRIMRVYPEEQSKPQLSKYDRRRGYTLFFPDTDETILPHTFRPHSEKTLSVRATPGECVPLTFAVCAVKNLRSVSVRAGYLRKKRGNIGPKAFQVGEVRYVASRVGAGVDGSGSGFRWQPVPEQIVPLRGTPLRAGITRQYWLRLHVPPDADPGVYAGKVSVNPGGGLSMSIKLELEVLPFKLKRPTHLATGLTYHVPTPEAFFGEARLWKRVRADLTDMRRHNLTTVRLVGRSRDNVDGHDKLLGVCREVGFKQPIVLKQSAPENFEEASRFVNGLYFWKVACRRKSPLEIEQAYNRCNGLPHDFFDAAGPRSQLAWPGPKFTVISSLRYERIRQGLDDLAYLFTLEEIIKPAPKGTTRTQAEALIAKIDGLVDENWMKHRGKDAKGKRWSAERLEEVRNQIIEMILKLQPGPDKTGS